MYILYRFISILAPLDVGRYPRDPIDMRDEPIRRLEPREPYPPLYRDPAYDRDLDRPINDFDHKRDPYDLPPRRPIERDTPYTIDYGHVRVENRPSRDPDPYYEGRGMERDRYPRDTLDQRRDLYDRPEDRGGHREYLDRYSDIPPRDVNRPRELYDPYRGPREHVGEPLDRYRDPLDRPRDRMDYLRGPSDRHREPTDRYSTSIDYGRDRYESRDKKLEAPSKRGAPSEYLRRIEERERERKDREGMRDFEMLYKKDVGSPLENKRSAADLRIPESELKPEVIPAADILDKPARERRPKNVSFYYHLSLCSILNIKYL